VFAVRATGDSMNGGKTPIGDGDWLVMRLARGAGLGSLAGRVVLVQTPDAQDGFAYQVKRLVQNGERWWLRSDNPERPSHEATADTTPIAQLVATIRPETLGPAVGARLASDEVGAAFGLASPTTLERTGRYEGHLFVVVSDRGHFTEPDRLENITVDRRPGETAFVLARAEAGAPWRSRGKAFLRRTLDAGRRGAVFSGTARHESSAGHFTNHWFARRTPGFACYPRATTADGASSCRQNQ
jgi:Peptidase S24-like